MRILFLYIIYFFISSCGILQKTLKIFPEPKSCTPISNEEAAKGSISLSEKNLIAHGGGVVNGIKLTNTLEALNFNYDNGVRLFEIDFSRTIDGHLVGIHDWERWANVNKNFSTENPIPTKEQFLNAERSDGLTSLSLKEIQIWLATHSDATLITDIKTDNTYAFNYMKRRKMDFNRIIPEVFSFREYLYALKNGISKPMLSYYRLKSTDSEILDFIKNWKVQYLAIPIEKMNSSFTRKVKDLGVCIFAHTINQISVMDEGLSYGVHGFYSDLITPNKIGDIGVSPN